MALIAIADGSGVKSTTATKPAVVASVLFSTFFSLMTDQKVAFSFGASKKIKKPTIGGAHSAPITQSRVFQSDHDATDDAPVRQLITAVQGQRIRTVNDDTAVKKPRVIPLISTNQWHLPIDASTDVVPDQATDIKQSPVVFRLQTFKRTPVASNVADTPVLPVVVAVKRTYASLEEQARAELLRDTTSESVESTRVIAPLLVRNQLPGIDMRASESEKFKHDVKLRPDVASLDAYADTPVEEFGAALLRGMGWKDGQPIGKNRNGLLKPVEVKPRPDKLGLGAEPHEIFAPARPSSSGGYKRPKKHS
jgi:hypothetical protein